MVVATGVRRSVMRRLRSRGVIKRARLIPRNGSRSMYYRADQRRTYVPSNIGPPQEAPEPPCSGRRDCLCTTHLHRVLSRSASRVYLSRHRGVEADGTATSYVVQGAPACSLASPNTVSVIQRLKLSLSMNCLNNWLSSFIIEVITRSRALSCSMRAFSRSEFI